MSPDHLHARAAHLRDVRTFDELETVTLTAARELTDADGATLVLRDGEHCFYAGEDAIAPLWKGQRFPMEQCISGWAMLTGRPAQVPDIAKDERIPLAAYRPTFVRSLVMMPMGSAEPRGAIGVYWSATGHKITDAALAGLTTLATEAGSAVQRLGLEAAPWAPNFALLRTS